MATIRPFRAFRYSGQIKETPEQVIAPPYDVISPEEADILRSCDHNITNLTLPVESGGKDRYEHAGEILRNWISNDVLVQDALPSLYLYEQEFNHPQTGESTVRRGFITRLALVEFGPGGVLPHERTLRKHREDRYRLRVEAEADLEPIFGMYPEEDVADLLADQISTDDPDLSVTDSGGVIHRLWKIEDEGITRRAATILDSQEVFIVDGHHRYITALRHRQSENFPEEHPLSSIMIFLCSMANPGLVILPTHRIVHSIDNNLLSGFLQEIERWFEVEVASSATEAFEQIAGDLDGVRYALLTTDRSLVIRPTAETLDIVRAGYPEGSPVADLDVTILHDFLFEKQLGITRELQESGSRIRYSRNDEEAINAVHDDGVQLVIGMQPPSVKDVENVARAGEVMPQKSTFFYPKLASGLLLNVARSAGDSG